MSSRTRDPGWLPLNIRQHRGRETNPNTYIQNLLTELNTNPNFTNVPPPPTPPPIRRLAAFLPQKAIRRLRCSLTFDFANPVYNFALARVHLQGDSTTPHVRVFFRLFISPRRTRISTNATTFRRLMRRQKHSDPVISLLGFPTNDMTSTIPVLRSGAT